MRALFRIARRLLSPLNKFLLVLFTMRINVLQKIVVMSKIVAVSIKEPLYVIFGSIFFRNTWTYRDSDRAIHPWARKILHIMRVKYVVFNPYNFEFAFKRPYIIISNHLSHFDIPLIYATFPKESIRMIAKKELFYIPIFGWAMKMAGCITIDRKNARQALKDLAVARKMMLEGVRVWIAPEGTRSRTGELGPFKKGGFKIALDTGAIIVPVTIIGSNKILPPKTFDLSRDEKVEIHIGKPIDTAQYQLKDIKKLIADTENEIKKVKT